MKRSLSGLVATLFVMASLGTGAAAPVSPSLQSILDARVSSMPGAGIVVGVIDHGKETIYFSGASGNARPLDAHTLFEIGSVSKTFTATILASMVLAGQVRLTDPVADDLPKSVNVPTKDGVPITLLNLAEQRSGLPRLPTNMTDANPDDPYASYDTAKMYTFLDGYTLPRLPGSAFEYSNYGIGLLGQALANRAKTTFPALLRTRVLDPLHMTQTGVAMAGAKDPALLAVGHASDGSIAHTWHVESMAPMGGIRSDMADMLKYLRCNMGQGTLAKACRFAQQPRADADPPSKIGLAWWTNPITGVISHNGETGGFSSYIGISGDHQTGVVLLSNGLAVDDIGAHVLKPGPFMISHCTKPQAVAPTKYAGEYCFNGYGLGFHVAAGKNPDELMIALDPQIALPYERTAPETFTNATVGASVTFVMSGARAVGFTFRQGPLVWNIARVGLGGAIKLDDATMQSYVGTYGESLRFVVTLRQGVLYVQLLSQPAFPVYPSAKDEFFYKVVDAQISFGRDASGKVTTLTLHQNGADQSESRVP